jgi:hypothetical protein
MRRACSGVNSRSPLATRFKSSGPHLAFISPLKHGSSSLSALNQVIGSGHQDGKIEARRFIYECLDKGAS